MVNFGKKEVTTMDLQRKYNRKKKLNIFNALLPSLRVGLIQ